MTQIERIRDIIRKFEDSTLFNIAEIRERTNIPQASVRRILGGLANNGEISRVEPGLFKVPQREDTTRFGGQVDEDEFQEIHRKFIGTQKYGKDTRQFFALTFEENEIDREGDLLDALRDFLNTNYLDAAGDTGYSDQIVPQADVQEQFRFPSIQVDEL